MLLVCQLMEKGGGWLFKPSNTCLFEQQAGRSRAGGWVVGAIIRNKERSLRIN